MLIKTPSSPSNRTISLDSKDFLNELGAHDWNYGYSNDSRAYKKGSENSTRLKAIAEQSVLTGQFIKSILTI